MSLSLLAPLALGLSLLAALPILAHLSRQTPRDRQAFGAMLLVERVVKRLRRRRRLKDPWLLLLRVLAVLALVLAASGLEFKWPGGVPEHGGSGRVVLVIDRSMSMQQVDGGVTLFGRARDEALSLVRVLPDGVLIGLVVFDDGAERLTPTLSADRQRVIAQLEGLSASWGRSDLQAGLSEARKLLGGEPGEVLLYSDEAGPTMVASARDELRRLLDAGAAVLPRLSLPVSPRNVAIQRATYGDGAEGGELTLRVANFGQTSIEVPCEVTLPDGQVITVFASLPPEGEAEQRVTIPREALGGVGEARCDDPDLPADDVRYFHLPRVGASRVLLVDGDPGHTPTRSEVYFLERALAPWGTGRGGVAIDITTPTGLMALDPEVHRVVFLANVSDPRPFGPALVDFVRRGGSVVVSAGSNVSPERYQAALAGLLPAPPRQVRALSDSGEEGVAVVVPQADHPSLEPFRRAGRGGFARVRAKRVLTFDAFSNTDEVTTILSLEGGLPFMVERRVGLGRAIWFTSTLDIGWSNFPLQAVYMPLMQRLVGWLGGEAAEEAARFDGLVGQPVSLDLPELDVDPIVRDGAGQLVASRVEGSTLRFTPTRPGAYALAFGDAPPTAWVAVNVDPVESDVRRPLAVEAVERDLAPELFRQTADLSRPLLAAAFALLLLQGLLATRRSS